MTGFDPLDLLDFHALHFRTSANDDIAVWAFDLLFHKGRDVRKLPLVERKELLMVLIIGAGDSRRCASLTVSMTGLSSWPPPSAWD